MSFPGWGAAGVLMRIVADEDTPLAREIEEAWRPGRQSFQFSATVDQARIICRALSKADPARFNATCHELLETLRRDPLFGCPPAG